MTRFRFLPRILLLAVVAVPAPSSTTSTAPTTSTTPPPTTTGAKPHGHPEPPAVTGGKAPAPMKIPPLPASPQASADLSKARVVKQVEMLIRHRVFADFAEDLAMTQGNPFQVGDTDYTATIIQYVPDFTMDINTGKVYSRTDQPNNPAFRIIVRQKGAPTDTTWAFLDMAPHYARKSMLAFQIMRIDYTTGKPVLAKAAAPKDGKAKTKS